MFGILEGMMALTMSLLNFRIRNIQRQHKENLERLMVDTEGIGASYSAQVER